ncbi:cobalt-precorrin-6A reductase [Prauserella marina]|uniref:cobalt-precorrin-6A reductase n=1 Tax=Prauserella marina TaxID=530584 RepID=UPI001FE92A8E|nr:cobalt-precorrin-6A reductase [Prauserella marina]
MDSVERRPPVGTPRVLILGGTSEARELASELTERGMPVVSSLAGRVNAPRLPRGEVRIGGFGGPAGLRSWLAEHDITAVVDATHPFAERISESAATASELSGIPLLRLHRPGWRQGPGDAWHWADDLGSAARLLPSLGDRIFLTSGRQGLGAFAHLSSLWFLARCVDPPTPVPPPHITVLLSRGPYSVEAETALLREHRINVVVTKDSGGAMTEAKLVAARRLDLPVVIVRRPPRPAVSEVTDVRSALDWILHYSSKE